MFYLLFALAIAVLAILSALNGLRKGKKYVWTYSVAQIAVALVSAILAALLSAGLSLVIFKALFSALASSAGEIGGLLTDLPLMSEALCALASMIFAPIFFYVIFSVLRLVLTIIAKIVLRAIAKKMAQKKGLLPTEEAAPVEPVVQEAEVSEEPQKKGKKAKKAKKSKDDGYFRISEQKNPKGMLCGALCGLVVFLVTMIPAVGMLGVVNDMTSWGIGGSNNTLVQTIGSVVDAGANNVGSKVVRAVGGDALYSMMTTYEVGGQKATLAKETHLLGVMGHAMSDMTNAEVDRAVAAETVRGIDDAFADTTLIPSVLPDFLSASKESWDQGEAYYGIKKPSFGKMDGLVHPILDVFGTSTDDTLGEDVSTLVDLTAYMVENDVMTNVKEEPITIFKNCTVTENVLYELLENDHLAPLVGDFSKFGLELFGEQLNTSVEAITPDSSNITNRRAEAKALSLALSEMATVTEEMKLGGFKKLSSLEKLGPMLDAFANTKTLGPDNTDKLLETILASQKIMDITHCDENMSRDFAAEINAEAKTEGYAETLKRFCDYLEMLNNFNK